LLHVSGTRDIKNYTKHKFYIKSEYFWGVSKLNNYINPHINPSNMANYANMQNTYVLDKKTGDVNADKISDVYKTFNPLLA
jgi:hypothetical protein